jgi:hypothetical protein
VLEYQKSEFVAAAKLLEVEVLDHLLIGAEKWKSPRECKLGFAT